MSFLFEYRGQIVGLIFVALLAIVIWSVMYGQKIIAREKTDAVFGNPSRALGGWHWTLMGVSTVLLLWFYFSWDAARSFFPKAANELCQVAKVSHAVNPIRSLLPLDSAYLRSTVLVQRESSQLNALEKQLATLNLTSAQQAQATSVLKQLRATLVMLSSAGQLDQQVIAQLDGLSQRIDGLSSKLADPDYPGKPGAEQVALATAQPRWGDTGEEVPLLPTTPRGYKFDAISQEMKLIAKDFAAVRNKTPAFLAEVASTESAIKSITGSLSTSVENDTQAEERKRWAKNLNKILKRIDDGLIFPAQALDGIQSSLATFDKTQKREQGDLWLIDRLMMPGGKILAGSTACSEQGSGRWLPKPSDTLRTAARISDPEIGYKGFPLLWYKWKPVSEMIGFLVPDFIADLVPGDYPRHKESAQVPSNFKSQVYNFATGNYELFSIPIPAGHIWDSFLRVIAGLFFGIILGVPLGLFMGLSRFAKGFFDPLIELYRPVPPLAWAPLILTIFGIQDDGKIFLLFMVAFAIMVISARTGATGTQLSKIHAAHSLGASNRQILHKVILPNSLPEILTGIRISIGVCWGTLVAAEMLAGTTGIGFVENVARKQSDYEIIWVTIIILGMLGLFFDIVMRWVIDRTIPWRGKG